MKKLLLLAFAVFAFAACTQNEVEELSANRADVPETLTVGFEGGDDTRIQLNEAQKTVWTKDDVVSVFYRSNANQKWQYQGETGERISNLLRVADATATETMHRTVVVYPYNENYYINTETYNIEATLPDVQHYAEESYGVGDNLMVSQSEFTQFSLKNVFGWLKIQLTGNGERVTSLTLRGNNEEQLAGLIYVDTATAESTLASEMGSSDDNNAGGNLIFDDTIVTELTLDCDEGVVLGAETTAFYIAVPPQTFEQGVAVEILCDGYQSMTLATTSEVVIERNHIKPMEVVAFEAQEVIPYNEIRYTATAKVEMDWIFDTFGADVVSHEWDSESGEGVITFDADVTTIGDDAFWDCNSLTSITIPDSITTIGNNAFEDCDSLTSITIPDSVTTIGEWAFRDCNSLTSITIPDSVTTIGVHVFYSCDSLTEFNGKFASEDGRCLIVDGTLNSFAPAGLTSYTIPDSVTTIGNSAFDGYDSLTSVTIPDSVTTIGDYAFQNCSSLTSVTIGDSVTTIGIFAFSGCSSLTSVTIPDSVTTIEGGAFCICDSLTEFNGKFASEDGRCLIVDGTLNSFAPAGLTSYTIPDSVTTIGIDAFSFCDSLTSITIPDSVTTIGDNAFFYCDSLTSITIPDSVTTIGYYAFAYCYSLTSVFCEATTPPSFGSYVFDDNASDRKIYVPAESVEAYKTADYWSDYADYIIGYDFENGVVVEPTNTIFYTATTKAEEPKLYPWTFDTFGADIISHNYNEETGEGMIIFDGDVTTIGDNAFFYFTTLTSITIPDSVTTIGELAFYACRSLTSITIPYGVTTIKLDAFTGCSYLENVTISDSVTTIGNKAFSSCSNLTSITIPDSVTTIGGGVFSRCSKLTKFNGKFASEDGGYLVVDGELKAVAIEGLTSYTIPDGITKIGANVFDDCLNLTSITIPNSVTTIGSSAFYGCKNITDLVIPDSVTTIEGYVFMACSGLKSITIPNSVMTIGNFAFGECYNIEEIIVGDNVTTIGIGAFSDCTSLTSITIPDSVTTMGFATFLDSTSLTSIYCKATTPPSLNGTGAFDNNASERKIYVPAESVDAYKTAEYWSAYADAIVDYNFE